jgi:deoxyhypusine synthase
MIHNAIGLVTVFCGIIFGRNDKTSPFSSSAIHGLYNIYHFLFVAKGPVDLVVVTSAQVHHDMLIAEKEHHCAGVLELIHRVVIRHLGVGFF